MPLFHITTGPEWQLALRTSTHRPSSLVAEGFIHLSTAAQWLPVANRLFRGRRDLVLLVVREDRLHHEVRYERADGDDYPHLYGPLSVDAVSATYELRVDAAGTICVPPELAR